jgi:hypothetical protein
MSRTRQGLAIALIVALAVSAIAWSSPGSAFADEEPVALISNHDVWKYDDTDTDLFGNAATDFRSAAYNDGAWQSGPSPLGYPASETNANFGRIDAGGTLMAKGANGVSSSAAYITYYLRKDFAVENAADITALNAKIAIDDGFVMYLNGFEVARENMPDGPDSHTTEAPGVWEATEARANLDLDLTAYLQYLVEGENTIAVDVHNRDASSSDIYWGMSLQAVYGQVAPPTEAELTPRQVNVHMGDDPSREVNVTYTTAAPDDTGIVIRRADGKGEALTVTGEASPGSSDQGSKYIHKIPVTGLAPDTEYTYEVGGEMVFAGAFKTAPAKGDGDPIRFIYLADTQVSNATNAEALGATLDEVANMDPDFVYLAGDITDTANSEAQWEWMFSNDGAFGTGGEEMFGGYLISAIQGNHDNNTFNRHINAPTLSSGGVENKIVYSYDYGPLTFIALNLEAARSDASARLQQEKFLRAAVADAKARGQWTAVGFHKSLITGASHITDSDVVEARTFWCPKFADLDVDMVLQGHDHVYSRGFVDALGYRADRTVNGDGSINKPANAPLYMVGGHAGGLKWYALKNYTAIPGDPIAPGYSFLDVDSANPAHNKDGVPSDIKQEQVIVEMEVSKKSVEVNTYMFKYDETADAVTTPKYLYDTMTMVRELPADEAPVEKPDTKPPADTGKKPVENPGVKPPAAAADKDKTPAVASTDLSKAKIAAKDRVWTGKKIAPVFTLTLNGKTLTAGKDYAVAATGANKSVGQATFSVTGKGAYKGTVRATFKILPKAVKITSAKAGGKLLAVKWAKAPKAESITKYELRWRVKGAKKWLSPKAVSASKTALTVKKLKRGKRYELQVRACKTVKISGKNVKYYSAWSAAKVSGKVK